MGRLEILEVFIPYCAEKRKVHIYLPKSYDCNLNDFFPVIYMHDGQNLFDDEIAFGGCSWGIKATLEKMEREGTIKGVIVVGLENNGLRRFEDYSPWTNSGRKTSLKIGSRGGDGEKYASFVSTELRNIINKKYRTLVDPDNTFICGSSMGGLISAYMVSKYPEIYGGAGILSIALWFAETHLLQEIDKNMIYGNQKYYIHVGTNETSDPENSQMPQIYVNNSLRYAKELYRKGINPDNVFFGIGVGDEHNEKSWSKYMEEMFLFLLNKKVESK